MKKCVRQYIIAFFLLIFCRYTNAQQTNEAYNFINTVTAEINIKYSVCTDGADLPAYLIKQVNQYLKKDTIMHLSVEEVKDLQSKLLLAQHAPKWPGNTLNHIPMMKSNIVKKVMGDTTKVWEYFKLKYPNPSVYNLYTFSKPVFIRNNTICFYYHSESRYDGLDPSNREIDASSGELCIYIKKDNRWFKMITVYRYIT